jgi:hypothetical protein
VAGGEAEFAAIEDEYEKVRAEADALRKLYVVRAVPEQCGVFFRANVVKPALPHPRFDERELQDHMNLLHEYNEIKDAGQTLVGRLGMYARLFPADGR